MPDKIVSKARNAVWGSTIIALIFITAILIVCIKGAIKENGKIDFNDAFFWLAAITILGILMAFFQFVFIGNQKLTVTKDGIIVNYGLMKSTWIIKYDEIENFVVTRVTNENTVNTTGGYYKLEIILFDGSSITIDENDYDNFKELKALIYHYKQIEEE